MALKRWAVRQLSGLLADYLEGITEQNLQASLSLEVGEVEIRHVRIHSELLREHRLQLLSSDVSVSARIPWRNLGSEPTVITVRDVWIEVQAQEASGSPTEAEAEEELQRWRGRRRRKVEVQVERARLEDEQQPRRGMAARFGHAALRQLQVQVDGLRARLHAQPVTEISVQRVALHEGHASGLHEVPKEVQRHPASLDKVLELAGLCAQLSTPKGAPTWPALRQMLSEMQHCLERDAESVTVAGRLAKVKADLVATGSPRALMGPLSLDARLWHSRTGGILWLQTELQVSPSAAGICISPSNAQCISDALNWYSESFTRPGRRAREETVQAPSGPEYAEMCFRRAKGEQLQDDQQRLDEIEDLAPIEWLARWQMKGLEQLGGPSQNSRGFSRWMPWRAAQPDATAGGEEDETFEDIVEEAGKQSFFEEVEEPRRLEVRVLIPHCKILSCSGVAVDANVLRVEGGVDCKLALSTAREGSMADFLRAAWDADVTAKLSSIAVLLDEEPLMLLRHGPFSVEDFESLPRTTTGTMTLDDDEFFDVESNPDEDASAVPLSGEEGAAVSLVVHCERFGGGAASSSVPWNLRVRWKQEPFRFMLRPASTHNALNTVLSVAKAVTLQRASPTVVPDLQGADTKTPMDPSSPQACENSEVLQLDLDLDVAAPVFRWGLLSEGNVTVALGRFVFRTSSHRPALKLAPAERCDWQRFSCFCQLTETSVTVQGDGVDCRVYEPTTMSLQAWRDVEDGQHWRWNLESEAFRWTIGPLFLKVAGQLPVCLDYAISPLRDALVLTDPSASTAASERPAALAAEAETTRPKVHVTVAIRNTEVVLCPSSGQVCLTLDDISGHFTGYAKHSEMLGKVGNCHLRSEHMVLVSFTRGASLQVMNADRLVTVTVNSTLIAVEWFEQQIRKIIYAVDEVGQTLAAGHEEAQGMLPVGDNAGMFAQLWSRYMITPIQARVRERAAQRLAELVPGVEGAVAPEVELVEELEDPQPRGQCSVEVNLFYEGLTAVFPESEAKDAHCVLQVGVSGAECCFRAFQSGDASVAVSLMAVNLELDGRTLLMPRRGDKLLRVDLLRRAHPQPRLCWSASWAQICILFRQRDYDKLMAFISTSITDALASRRRAEVTSEEEKSNVESVQEQQPRARFRLDVGAPLVFMPTDGRSLLPARCDASYDGGQLEVDERGEPTFRPLATDGVLVLDFGHVAASDGAGGTELQLRGAQVLSIDAEAAQPRELLWPVSLQATLSSENGPIEFHAVSMDGDGVRDHHMSLTRVQLSLILDVLAENICYQGRSGHTGAAPVREQPTQGAKERGRGFRFSWRWPGELSLGIAFTKAAPLGCLKLRGGMLGFSSMPSGSKYELNCQSLTAIDTRAHSRNLVKTLLESVGTVDQLGFAVEVNVPIDTDTLAVIELQKPTMHVLPQLVMDLVTAGLSSWQHCTFRNDRVQVLMAPAPQPRGYPESEEKAADKRGTRVQVNFLDGCFRIAERWAEPTEHFEFTGSVMIHILVHAEGIRIERFDLESGALRLHSSRRNPTTLCPCLEWSVRGDQKRVDDGPRRKRHTTYELRSVIIPPYSVRMSLRDHRAMANALLELLGMDAESAEPAVETKSRDPLALQLVENRLTLMASLAIQGAEVQVMGEEGGNEWPGLCGNARCQLLEVTVDSRQGSTPTINVFGQELEVDISSRNHRLGAWEPVLPRCGLRFSYHMQRKPDGGPRDVFIRGDVAAIKPVQLVISAPFVHLASRVFDSSEDMRYGYLLAGVNISGIACHVSVEDGGEGLVLPSSSQAISLDALLKGRSRASTGAPPCLVLHLPDSPGAEPCKIQYGREADLPWDTKTSGFLMCRLVMPRPPQLVLLITSTVCVWNRTPADLEIRFLAPGREARSDLEPVPVVSTELSVDARLLSEGVSSQIEAPAITAPVASSDDAASAEGTLRLGAGQLLSAPVAAQLRMGQAVLQLRPALTDGRGIYGWSEQFFAVPVATSSNDTTVCSSPPEGSDLPKNWLYLRTSCGDQQGWSHVEVQAPFTVVNACPCDILCQFNPPVTRHKLGKERERLPVGPGNIDLVVDNGYGGEVVVPPSGTAEVMPLRLDDEGCFRWVCNGRQGRTRPRWQSLNSLIVVLHPRRAEVEWHCSQCSMSPAVGSSSSQLRIAPTCMLPAFEFVAEDLTVSFAVRDTQGLASSWCLPLRAVVPRGSRTETVQLEFKGMYINLNARRSGRELIVYTRWWFVNSTGLDVRLLQPGGPGPMHPVASFSSKVSILPEIQNDAGDGVAFLGLRSHAPVEVSVPDVGGANAVALTPLHPCCLRTDTVALPEALRGVPSCLVSLVPAMMLFNHTQHAEVAFRQYGCPADTMVLVPPNSSRPLWWTSATEQRMQVAARNLNDSVATKRSWCNPFELSESRIGAYPVILKCTQGALPSRELLCVCIDYDAASLAVTVKDSSHCHMLANKHPEVELTGAMEGAGEDSIYSFHVAYGEQVPFAGRGPPPGESPRLRLTVRHASDSTQFATVMVDLHRSGAKSVPLWSGGSGSFSNASQKRKSTLRVSAAVSVVLRNRVALVTITPGFSTRAAQDGDEEAEIQRTFNGELRIDSICVGLVIEGPSRALSSLGVWGSAAALASSEPRQRREVFTVKLTQLVMNVAQTPNRSRDVDFQIWDVQVDMQSPKRDVILKSTSRPAVRTHSRRDDIRMLDVHLREVHLELGDLEVSVTGALMDQARLLRRNLTVGMGGLTFEQVLARAKGGIHLSNPQPPASSSKLVVNKLAVGDAKVDVWCQLHLPDAHYLPKSLRDTIQVVSLGATRLDIKGAQVKLPAQAMFHRKPAEGNTSIVFSKVWLHYLPLVKACWRSLLQHSNIFLGGLLSRHTWNPRQRREHESVEPLCQTGRLGELQLRQ